MSVSSVRLADVLSSLPVGQDPIQVLLSNGRKAVYVLSLLAVDAERHVLRVASPTGRTARPEPSGEWILTLRDAYGAYQSPVLDVQHGEGGMELFVSEKLDYVARRRNQRFPVVGRNPVAVQFKLGGITYGGQLLDVGLDGLGFTTGTLSATPSAELTDFTFKLRGTKISLSKVSVANISYLENQALRVGATFDTLAQGEHDDLRHALNRWYLAQSPSFSRNQDA